MQRPIHHPCQNSIGATELCVNQALWAADSGYAGRGHVLFLMPTQNQMDDFAQARFDRALQDSCGVSIPRHAASHQYS